MTNQLMYAARDDHGALINGSWSGDAKVALDAATTLLAATRCGRGKFDDLYTWRDQQTGEALIAYDYELSELGAALLSGGHDCYRVWLDTGWGGGPGNLLASIRNTTAHFAHLLAA